MVLVFLKILSLLNNDKALQKQELVQKIHFLQNTIFFLQSFVFYTNKSWSQKYAFEKSKGLSFEFVSKITMLLLKYFDKNNY